MTLPRPLPADAAARAVRLAPDGADAGGVRGLVSGTIPFSAVDGPGNRFAVFLQGCNMDCPACHNPHTIRVCDDCGACVDGCPTAALEVVGGAVRWRPDACIGCDACIAACPDASSPKARSVTPDALVAEVRPVAPFLSGVTVSGGEATQQATFVRAFFAALAADPITARLTRFVDGNGLTPPAVWDALEPVMDGAMIDLKAFDDDAHRALTGTPVAPVKASIDRLAARGLLHEVRLLIVPGRNDAPDALHRAATWLAGVAPDVHVRVTGFRRHGVRPGASGWREPTAREIRGYGDAVRAAGLANVTVV